jgi:hypothetical protein
MQILTRPALAFFLGLLPALPCAAGDMTLLTPACEEALALSALPERLRDSASVYILTEQGYALSRKGDGAFTCIVERNHVSALVPQCPDAAGASSIIPGIIMKSNWALEGLSPDERATQFRQRADAGALQPPAGPGVSYMLSNFNFAWSVRQEALVRVAPHIMYYAPDVSNDDIGGSMEDGLGANRGYPFIVEEGIHGYIISLVEHASDSSAVEANCRGQLPEVTLTIGEHRHTASEQLTARILP